MISIIVDWRDAIAAINSVLCALRKMATQAPFPTLCANSELCFGRWRTLSVFHRTLQCKCIVIASLIEPHSCFARFAARTILISNVFFFRAQILHHKTYPNIFTYQACKYWKTEILFAKKQTTPEANMRVRGGRCIQGCSLLWDLCYSTYSHGSIPRAIVSRSVLPVRVRICAMTSRSGW